MQVRTLSAEDVVAIHEVLVADFAADADPISPNGVKSEDLLRSAVSRQFTGYQDRLKYDTALYNAASLTYGICLNHPFHNGNKRTALVSLLCHLDKNDISMTENVTQDELYSLMIKIASHGFARERVIEDLSDDEVRSISKWLRDRTRHVETGERVVTYRELKAILRTHGFSFEHPKGNYIDVVRYEERGSILGINLRKERIRYARMPNPGDGVVASRGQIKKLRRECNLTQEDGCDSQVFYSKGHPPDYFVMRYRNTLRRLART